MCADSYYEQPEVKTWEDYVDVDVDCVNPDCSFSGEVANVPADFWMSSVDTYSFECDWVCPGCGREQIYTVYDLQVEYGW